MYDKAWSQRPVTATDKSHQQRVEEMIRENLRLTQKDFALKLGTSIKKDWATLSTFLDCKILCQMGTMKID